MICMVLYSENVDYEPPVSFVPENWAENLAANLHTKTGIVFCKTGRSGKKNQQKQPLASFKM